jgi:hypothetical protein
MELYFNRLVSLQYKIMVLLTNAWTLQANGNTAQGDNWRRTTYANAIRDETYRFRDAADKIVAGTLRVSSQPNDAPVSVPPEVADKILPSLDFGVMNLAPEGQGLRVRVLVGRYLNEGDTYTIVDNNNNPVLGLPSADSGLWKTLPAGTAYDAWRLRDGDSAPSFYIDKYWIMYSFVAGIANGTQLKLVDKWGLTDDNDTPKLYGLRTANVGRVDENMQPSASGKLFGSTILVKRAAARTMLRIYNDGKSSRWDYCKPSGQAKFGKENDYFIISGNCYGGGWAGYQRLVPFYFAGPQDSAPGDFTLGLTTRMTQCKVSESTCIQYYSFGHLELLDNDQSVLSILRYENATQVSYPKAITWQKNHTYKLNMRLVHTGTSNGTPSQIWRGPLLLRFNQ